MIRRLVGALLVVVVPLAAQQPVRSQGRPLPAPGDGRFQGRGALEARLQERVEAAMRQQLGLTDAQAAQMREVNRRLDERRRALATEERGARVALRTAMDAADTNDQRAVGDALDRLLRAQRERVNLLEAEQRELSQFLTPVQRARYLGLQEQFRRRVEELRQGQGGGRPGATGPARRPFVGGGPGRRPPP
jgi:Spy/CpxP family protein refolding chaperone